MTTAGRTTDSREPSVSLPKVNTLAIVSISLVAAVAFSTGLGWWWRSWGIIFAGITWLAIPAVGAGHVALQQIKVRGERSAMLAYIALGICYLFAAYTLVSRVYGGIMYS